jgi:co-chaperonin GroES (HSP10)
MVLPKKMLRPLGRCKPLKISLASSMTLVTRVRKQMTIELADQDRTGLYEDAIVDGGLLPANNKVVIRPVHIAEFTTGGIALTDETIEREVMAQIFAILIAVGPDAWKGKTIPAVVGDTVMVAKFTGQLFTGPDGKRYRIIHDLDVIGKVVTEGVSK